jgi:hypothetical protein
MLGESQIYDNKNMGIESCEASIQERLRWRISATIVNYDL